MNPASIPPARWISATIHEIEIEANNTQNTTSRSLWTARLAATTKQINNSQYDRQSLNAR